MPQAQKSDPALQLWYRWYLILFSVLIWTITPLSWIFDGKHYCLGILFPLYPVGDICCCNQHFKSFHCFCCDISAVWRIQVQRMDKNTSLSWYAFSGCLIMFLLALLFTVSFSYFFIAWPLFFLLLLQLYISWHNIMLSTGIFLNFDYKFLFWFSVSPKEK